jgi:hypothetical protein
MYGTLMKKIADAVPGQNQELPESTGITLRRTNSISKKFIIRYDYSVWLLPMQNMRFTETNDLIATDYVSIDPALGFRFGYTDLVL